MDKAEYKIAVEHIKKLIAQGEYAEASHIADTIEWRRVKSVMVLCMVSDLYKINRRYEDARELLYMAYERNPGSRTILYSLCDLCIKLEEFVAAIEYYKSFVEVAPRDTGRYVLQYRLYQAQDVSLEERIEVLEQLKSEEYIEKWAYELAYLYHRIGFATKCVEECDELILWFGKGRYVYKAMELKMLHEPLTPSQQEAYDQRFDHMEHAKDMTRVLPRIDSGDSVMTDDSMIDVTDAPTVEIPQEYIEQELQGNVEEIQVKTLDVANSFNTINLQKELADSLREILEDTPDANTPAEVSVEDEEGQLSFVDLVPESDFIAPKEPQEKDLEEQEEIEKQITGQLRIEDVLTEWNKHEGVSAAAAETVAEEDICKVMEEVPVLTEDGDLIGEISEAIEHSEDEMPEDGEEALEQPDQVPVEKDSKAERRANLYQEFVRVQETEAQIMEAVEGVSMKAVEGNVIVTGHDLSICFDFIKTFMFDLKRHGFSLKGKTAKISAVNLNKKAPSEIISKVEDGVLIIERAGRLKKDTIEQIVECLHSASTNILVFLTDTDQGMDRFAERYPDMAELFELRVDIRDYTGEDLIEYATKYAYDNEYSIDVMGLLALRTRIDELISNDDAPDKEDAKNIVDEAIEHVNKKNFRHFMDVLLRRRYDEEDMIILGEQDFLIK